MAFKHNLEICIGEGTVKQMAFKRNKDKYKIRQLNYIMLAKQFVFFFFF